mgnify:CR=1 FL=1
MEIPDDPGLYLIYTDGRDPTDLYYATIRCDRKLAKDDAFLRLAVDRLIEVVDKHLQEGICESAQ